MTDKTAIGDRFKRYEAVTKIVLPRRTYTICRVDGRAFHTLLRKAYKPFDDDVTFAMNEVAKELCRQIQGAQFSYTQSDEVSVLITDFETVHTEPWFGGVVQKMASVAASIATGAFIDRYGTEYGMATFDARVFTIPEPVEVANYFVWRQRDAVRNSISAVAHSKFSQRQLHGKNSDQMEEMLFQEHGINWADFSAGYKRGRVIVRKTEDRPVAYYDTSVDKVRTTTVPRSLWYAEPAPHFSAEPDGWLASVIPSLPSLRSTHA